MNVHERLTTHHSIRLLLVAEAGCNRNDRYSLGCVRLGTEHRWGIAVDGRSLRHTDPADGLTFSKMVFVLIKRKKSVYYTASRRRENRLIPNLQTRATNWRLRDNGKRTCRLAHEPDLV
jgi:hypothetical protein